jgi:hypothetical protein
MVEQQNIPPRPTRTAPHVPKVAGARAPKMGLETKSLLRVFKPLLVIPLLAIAAVLVYLFVPEKVERYSLNLYCLIFIGVLTGIVLLFVLVRLANYLIGRRRIKQQEELIGRGEIWRLQESLEEQWEKIAAVFKSASVGLYDMPWYLILGGVGGGAQTLLENSGLTFPDLDEAHALAFDPDTIERWVFANEAIFIDTTRRSKKDLTRDSDKAEWEAFLSLLANKRSRCPINGVLLTVSAFELAKDSEESRKEKARQIQYSVRSIQKTLRIRVPSYLIVTQMERILGFSEFFDGLDGEEREQMFGWSNPNPPYVPFSSNMFTQAFDDLSRNIKEGRLTRLAGDISQDVANRAFLFPEEFASLVEPLTDYVEILFKETRFTEAPIFSGFYFIGGNKPGSLAALYSKKHLPENLLGSAAQKVEDGLSSQSFFIKDLFVKKIFLEPGLVIRPKSVFRKNLKIKTVRTLVLGIFLLLGTLYLFSFLKKSAREIQMLEADIREARAVLVMGKKDAEMLPLCIRLTTDKKRYKQKGFLNRVLGLDRYDRLARELGVIHRGLFQETVLKNILNHVEKRLGTWRGDRSKGDQGFHLYSAALIEYSKWSNPSFPLDHPLDIQPFLDFLQVNLKAKQLYLEQFRIYIEEGGRGRRIVAPSSDEIIRGGLEAAGIYLRLTTPNKNILSTQLSDAHWWLSLAVQLREIYDHYNALLSLKVPGEEMPAEDMFAHYDEFRGFLDQMFSKSHNLVEHIKGGRDSGVLWINVEDFYKRLLAASRGVAAREAAVERDRLSVAGQYNKRVVATIIQLTPVINLASGHPSQRWLIDVLAKAFGSDFIDKASDLGVGNMTLDLLNQMESYNLLIQDLYTNFEPWMEELPTRITRLDDHDNPLRSAELNLSRGAILQRREPLAEFASKREQSEPRTSIQVPDIAIAQPEKEKLKESKRKTVESFWQVLSLSSRISQWLAVQDRIRMYIESLYLEEAFDRADFRQDILNAKSWHEIKGNKIFRRGDGAAMVTPIGDFLDHWIQSIPQSIKGLAKKDTDVKHYPELRGFEKLLEEITVLHEDYMEKLRISANNFAKCIQAMDMDAGVAWRTLRNSPGPKEMTDQTVSWRNLRNLTLFKEALETEKGPIARTVTGQLEEIENHVFKIYRTELIKSHQSRREQVFNRYNKLGIADKFPFRIDGPQIDEATLLRFFEDLKLLEGHYDLGEGLYRVAPDGKKVPISAMAKSIVKEMVDDRWKRFYKESSNFESFLFNKRTPRAHKFEASIVSGQVGSYFHWIRIAFDNGTFKDINVYGDPTSEIIMLPKDRSITVQGLDAARIPQVSKEVSKGDYALLQMIYLFGKPFDDARTTWLVDVELPMSKNPPFNVKSTFKFVFTEGIPLLPDWKGLGK